MRTTTITIAMALLATLGTGGAAWAGPAAQKSDGSTPGESSDRSAAEPTDAPSMLDVHVARSITRSDALAAKIREDVVRVLRAHRIELDAQTKTRLSIGVGGESYAYRVSLGVLRDGTAADVPAPLSCECTNEELLVRITQSVVDLVPTLRGDVAAEPSPTVPPRTATTPVAGPRADRPAERAPLRGLGRGGVALLAVGGVLAFTGVGLVAAPKPDRFDVADVERPSEPKSSRPAGYAMLATGGAAIVVGAVLLGVDRRRATRRRLSFSPIIGPRLTGFSLATRF